MIAITSAALAINGGLNSSSISAMDDVVWHHYAAVEPTKDKHGSKEFWASSADGCTTHTFTNPGVTCEEHDFSTYDSFASLSRDDDRYVWCFKEQRDLGIIPVVAGNTVTYGLYPQKNVNDSALISALELTTPDTNGYYFYENAYYAKASATPYFGSNYNFDNDTKIVDGTTYWFKCEPITWNILSSNNNGDFYLSSVLLDAHRYNESYFYEKDGHYANNYQYSEIRSFLNNNFYNSAFALGDSYIQTTTVDSTQDKVFLPSRQDYTNSSYGFTTSYEKTDTRCCKTTDWARARGAYCDAAYNSYYWTRSPYSGYDTGDYAWHVRFDGYINYETVSNTYTSVRPAIMIKNA